MAMTAAEILAEARQVSVPVGGSAETPVRVTDRFREGNNHPAGIRPHHAIEVVEKGKLERLRLPDGDMVTLASRRVAIGNPYVMLVTAVEGVPTMGGPGTHIDAAWRLYDADDADSPLELFASFLERYGLVVVVSGHRGRFLGRTELPNARAGADLISVETVAGAPIAQEMNTRFRVHKDQTGVATWSYAVDLDRYQRDVARGRS